jgi:hypothetical protein
MCVEICPRDFGIWAFKKRRAKGTADLFVQFKCKANAFGKRAIKIFQNKIILRPGKK